MVFYGSGSISEIKTNFANFRNYQILRKSDVGQRIHSYKQGSYKLDLVRFNHTSHEIIMTNIRDDLLSAHTSLVKGYNTEA